MTHTITAIDENTHVVTVLFDFGGGNTYTANLPGLPLEDTLALCQKLCAYAHAYLNGKEAVKVGPIPQAVLDLIDVPQDII